MHYTLLCHWMYREHVGGGAHNVFPFSISFFQPHFHKYYVALDQFLNLSE